MCKFEAIKGVCSSKNLELNVSAVQKQYLILEGNFILKEIRDTNESN